MTNLPFNGEFKVTCEYGRKGSWAAGYHTGIDLVGITSTDIYSVCNGTVTMAKSYGDYGNCIKIVDSETLNVFLFAHLASFNVSVGQKVGRTTKIGVMGNTGNSTGAHLHLEMRTKNDVYGEVLAVSEYLGIPNVVGTYNSNDYELEGIPNISYEVHLQDIGWQSEKSNGELAGTTGEAKRLEAIKIFADIPVQYKVHVQDIGWTDYVPNGCMAGTTGESKRIEAIEIISSKNMMEISAHIESIGWIEEKTGTTIQIGTEGRSLRLEALNMKFLA